MRTAGGRFRREASTSAGCPVSPTTVERNGFRVVTTLAQGEAGTPVRVVAVLGPGQSVMLSTPRESGVAPVAVEISRQADTVLVRKAAAATN